MFCDVQKMFSGFEAIFSTAENMVVIPENMGSVVQTPVWTMEKMFLIVQTAVCRTRKNFSEAGNIFQASENGFSVTEKKMGTLPYFA
jgi:hypothetical protein